MASELLNDETFFTGIVNNSDLQNTEKIELLNVSHLHEKQKCKTPRKSSSQNLGERETRKTASSQKENSVTERTDVKKPGRPAKKCERQPLKILNTTVKTPKKNSVSSTTKKGGLSPAVKENRISPAAKKKGISPAKKKNTAKFGPSPSKMNGLKKEKESIPKITVYKDVPSRATVQEKGNKRNGVGRLSKSWDGLNATGRRSHVENKVSKLVDSGTKKGRYSLNDLSSIKTPNKKDKLKNEGEPKKSLPKSNSRLTKFKPGHPEFEEMLIKLETLFPNVDPEFMKSQFTKFKGSLPETIEFIIIKEKTNELPTRDSYIRRLETEKLQNKFMENFSVENFLKMIPDPWEHFLKIEKKNCVNYLDHSLHYLKNKYKKHYLQAIQDALKKNECSLYLANKELKRKNRCLKMRATNRSKYECDAGKPTTFNIQFIHEVAFIENETKIRAHIKKTETVRYKKFKEAEKTGTLLECQSCNDFSLLPDDTLCCPANHVFCKDCVVKYVGIEIGKDNFQFKCLIKCEQKFSVESLQTVLSPSILARIIKRNQVEEIKSAGIDNLVCCPFCYYVTIMPPEMSVLKCLNPTCMIKSCRHCKQFSHIPLKCHELEKFDKSVLEIEVEIEKREGQEVEKQEEQEIEKKVEDPSLTCIHCNEEFFKKDDSNVMVCPCGATVCSVCRQPFPECQHFSNKTCHKPSQQLSFNSDDTNFAENRGDVAEDDLERSSNCSENFLEFLPSESDSF